MITRGSLLAGLALSLTLLAAPASTLAEEDAILDVGGRYSVSGSTIDRNGLERHISGVISIKQEGASFTSHSEFKTTDPSMESSPAEVIGTGEGRIVGNKLSGTADIQLIASQVPGLGVEFGLAPISSTSVQIKSTWKATITEDGSITVETSNVPAEGETDYRPTTTTLTGKRMPGGLTGTD